MPDLGNLDTPYIISSVLWTHCPQASVSLSKEGTYGTGRSLQKTSHPQKLSKAMWLSLAGAGLLQQATCWANTDHGWLHNQLQKHGEDARPKACLCSDLPGPDPVWHIQGVQFQPCQLNLRVPRLPSLSWCLKNLMAQYLQTTGEMGLTLSTKKPLERRILFMGKGVSLKLTLALSKHLLHTSSIILCAWC